ncbi:MAG: sugar phosphate isomerase/epimerase [Candidatus Bathyarchaeota archaeon]|nr:sugar phosphate isomerase/epimerase [Candidatus Bathyarchaeota archaeon]
MLKLGLVTYNLAKDWDLSTIIDRCAGSGFEAVELRTNHAHRVELSLSKEERETVKEAFRTSPIRLLSLGTACEYHAVEKEEVIRNIEMTKKFVKLARDVGAIGVKVRPNGLQLEKGIPVDVTLEQIGSSLQECGRFAKNYDIEIWLEAHGKGSNNPEYVRRIMEVADHESVGVCWNSNRVDVRNGSVKESFNLVKEWIRSVHIRELHDRTYPWRELFSLIKDAGYDRYCLAEIHGSPEPERLMRYYRALFEELTR